jgi:hypothetical protein
MHWTELLYERYVEEVKSWDWGKLEGAVEFLSLFKQDFVPDVFIGTVFDLMPSGVYYTPWACSNVTTYAAKKDELFREALEVVANEHGMAVVCGEGDPCDLFLTKIEEV